MKLLIASDIHGSAFYCRKLLEAYEKENAQRNHHQNRQRRHYLRQRAGHGHQLCELAFRGLGHLSRPAELGVCDLLSHSVLKKRLVKPAPDDEKSGAGSFSR